MALQVPVRLTNGLNNFYADFGSAVNVNNESSGSNSSQRWCLYQCQSFSFTASNSTIDLFYWDQFNTSFRWIPPVICADCGLQSPFVGQTMFSNLTYSHLTYSDGTTSYSLYFSLE